MVRKALYCFISGLFLYGCGDPASTTPDNTNTKPAPPIETAPTSDVRSPATQVLETKLSGISAELHQTHAPRNPIETARNATLFIDTGFGTGSGFFLGDSCLVVTNKHVVKLDDEGIRDLLKSRNGLRKYLERGVASRDDRHELTESLANLDIAAEAFEKDGAAKAIKISLVNGRELEGKVLAYSDMYDLAYLKIRGEGCPSLPTSFETDLPLGQKVYTIGNPVGLKYSVTSGIISGSQTYDEIDYIQTDAAINPGNSGGPLIDADGNIVGVNTMILSDSEGIGFALPIHSVLTDIENNAANFASAEASTNMQLWLAGKDEIKSDTPQENPVADAALKACIAEYDNREWGGAIAECEIASNAGLPRGQYFYGDLLLSHDDRRLKRKGVELIKSSANSGYAEALYLLGRLHAGGRHLHSNAALSYDLYKQACEKEYSLGCNSAGLVSLDSIRGQEAIEFFNKAKAYGSVQSIFNLAYLHESGRYLPKDEVKAYKLYEEAAMLGSNIAQFKLFWLNYKGIGTTKDYQQAYVWLLVSELDKTTEEDAIPGWSNDIPTGTRHFFENMISSEQKSLGSKEAHRLRKTISIKADKHRTRHLYQRNVI